MKGVEIGSGDVYLGCWLVINFGIVVGMLFGEVIVDLVFGLNVIWIESVLKEQVQIQGYIVVEVSMVVVMYFNYFISQYVVELFGCQEV